MAPKMATDAGVPTAELVRRRAHLDAVDPESLRSDIDEVLDRQE